jgi:AdoMet-dependent heme synthase
MTNLSGSSDHPRRCLLPLDTVDLDCDCAFAAEHMGTVPLAFPTIYSLELTPWCNSRCAGCSNVFVARGPLRHCSPPPSPDTSPPLTAEQWERIIATIAPHARRIKITGGEPTAHPQLEPILASIHRRGIPFTLFTNGLWTQPERIIDLLKKLPEGAGLLISLHGADAATHEAFTGVRGSFAQTLRSIEQAARVGNVVHTNTVLTRHNYFQIEAIARLSQSLGTTGAVFNRYIGSPFAPPLAPEPADLLRAIATITRLNRAGIPTRVGTALPLCFARTSAAGCLAGIASCTIDPWGNMRPCNHMPQTTGNILTGSLTAAWHSRAMASWRSLAPNQCRACTAFATCRGGCLAEAVLRGAAGDPLRGESLLPTPQDGSPPADRSQTHSVLS